MGIRGLETYLHKSKGCVKFADIPSLAQKYKKEFNRQPEIVIDINSITYFLNKNIAWTGGAQMKEFSELLEGLIKRLQDAGLIVTIFVDGVILPEKVNSWIEKRRQYAEGLAQRFNQIRSTGKIFPEENFHWVRFPHNVKDVFVQTMKQCECNVIQCVLNVDIEAAIYAKRNNCFGVLGQDTDFVIFNCTRHYFSMKNLDMYNLTTVTYCGEDLAKYLNIERSHIPIWATLAGNGFIDLDLLTGFHRSLAKRNERFCRPLTFMNIAKFINKNLKRNVDVKQQLPDLIEKIAHSFITLEAVTQSLSYYDLIVSPLKNEVDYCDDAKWMETEQLISLFHKSAKLPPLAYNVVFNAHSFYESYFEDPYNKDPIFPFVRELCWKIYGILLSNHPRERDDHLKVREIVFIGNALTSENVCPIYPTLEEFDLVQILMGDDKESKMNLFLTTLDVPKDLLIVDEKALVPTIALKYVLMKKIDLQTWEIDAVVATTLLLPHYSVKEINTLDEFPVAPEGILLYWRLIRVFEIILILNGICGHPISPEFANPVNYQDGKLFQNKYLAAKGGASLENLCESKDKEIQKARQIIDLLTA